MLDRQHPARIINNASGETGLGRDRRSSWRERLVIAHGLKQAASLKICARPGCEASVKKATAKYCSIRCCALDPSRKERLRRQARRAPIIPLAHQLPLMFQVHRDIEASLDDRTFGREDIPAGLQRLRAV
jgi:hypothetical protein